MQLRLARLAKEGHTDLLREILLDLGALDHSDPRVRLRAWRCFDGGNMAALTEELTTGVLDDGEDVRSAVVQLLAQSEESVHGELLLGCALEDESPAVVELALDGLAGTRHYFTIPFLLDRARAVPDVVLRDRVVAALEGISREAYGTIWQTWDLWWERFGENLVEAEDRRLTPGELRELFLSTDSVEADRIAAIEGLKGNEAYLSSRELLDLVTDRAQPTAPRLKAIQAIIWRADRIKGRLTGFLEAIYGVLEREGPATGDEYAVRLKEQFRVSLQRALARLNRSGVDFGKDPGLWRAYMERLHLVTDPAQLAENVSDLLRANNVDPRLQQAALIEVTGSHLVEARPAVLELLRTAGAEARLKAQAVVCLSVLSEPDDVEVLEVFVGLLESAERRVADAAYTSLLRMTELRLPRDSAAWREALRGN